MRLAAIEDDLGDVRGEIIEADEPREIGWAHAVDASRVSPLTACWIELP
jgi:hypothetical protein